MTLRVIFAFFLYCFFFFHGASLMRPFVHWASSVGPRRNWVNEQNERLPRSTASTPAALFFYWVWLDWVMVSYILMHYERPPGSWPFPRVLCATKLFLHSIVKVWGKFCIELPLTSQSNSSCYRRNRRPQRACTSKKREVNTARKTASRNEKEKGKKRMKKKEGRKISMHMPSVACAFIIEKEGS